MASSTGFCSSPSFRLTHRVIDLCHFDQLLTRNAASFCSIGFHEAAVHRKMRPLHQSHFHALPHDPLKQLLEQLRLRKPSMAVVRERGMVWVLFDRNPGPRNVAKPDESAAFHQLALLGSDAKRALADVYELQIARILYQM